MAKVDGKSVTVEGDLVAENSEFGAAFDKDVPKVIVRYADGMRTVVPKVNVVYEEPGLHPMPRHPAEIHEPAHVPQPAPNDAQPQQPYPEKVTHDKPANDKPAEYVGRKPYK